MNDTPKYVVSATLEAPSGGARYGLIGDHLGPKSDQEVGIEVRDRRPAERSGKPSRIRQQYHCW